MARVVTSAGRLLRGVLALAILFGLLVGVPWLLVTAIGWPLPDHLPSPDELVTALTSPLDDKTILNLLAIIAWILWVNFVRDVLVEAILTASEAAEARRGRPRPPRLHPAGPVRLVAAVLVGAIVGAVLLDAARGAMTSEAMSAATAADGSAHTPAVAVAAVHSGPRVELPAAGRPEPARPAPVRTTTVTVAADSEHSQRDVPAWARDAPGGTHRVVEGDTLWDIAAEKLGDPWRWRDIYRLNRGRPQANGHALTYPDEIHVGWVLILPARIAAPPPLSGSAGGGPSPVASVSQTAPSPPASPSAAPASPAPPSTPPVSGAPATPAPSGSASSPASSCVPSPEPAAGQPAEHEREHGVCLPWQGWVSLGLAAAVAVVAEVLRLQQRRLAPLRFPIRLRIGPTSTQVPDSMRAADEAGSRLLSTRDEGALRGVMPAPLPVPAPIGVDRDGAEISLFALPGPGLALYGDGAPAAARAILSAVLTTGVTDAPPTRPVVVTPAETLAELLPAGIAPVGLDPNHETFDGERLVVVAHTAAAVSRLENEMIHRRRLLDDMGVDSVAALNADTRHLEHLPPCVLLMPADPNYAARLHAVAVHRAALQLHPVVLGAVDGLPTYEVAADGTVTAPDNGAPIFGARLSTLADLNLAGTLSMVSRAAARPETGDEPTDPSAEPADLDPADIAALHGGEGTAAPVQLGVLGPVTLATPDGPITTGVRSGSRAVLAFLAVHPGGATYEEIAADLHGEADVAGVNRVRTDLNAVRSLLRDATGIEGRGKFIVYDAGSGRYRIDPELIEVDLWRMLSAIDRANKAADDTACLAALREAVDCYRGDFGEGQDWPWASGYATTHRDHLLNVYMRIAEILETDGPDQAIAALEAAIDHEPVNEELYQRLMRIHGWLKRPDAVRRVLRLLEDRLADLDHREPSEATRRVAARQLNPPPDRPDKP